MTPERKGSSSTLNSAPRSDSPVLNGTGSYLSAPSQVPSASHTPSPLSLSNLDSAVDARAHKSPPLTTSPTEDAFAQTASTPIPLRSDSLSQTATPVPSPSTARVTSPSEPADPVLGAWAAPRAAAQPPNSQPSNPQHPPSQIDTQHSSQPPPLHQSLQQVQSGVMLTPATPESAMSPSRSRVDSQQEPPNGHVQMSRTDPPAVVPSQPVSIQLNGADQNLTVRQHTASRDSQISLPEEAKRYYATMASPALSPAGSKFSFASSNPGSPMKSEHTIEGPSSQRATPDGMMGMNGVAANGAGLGIPVEGVADAGLTVDGRGRTDGRATGSRRAGSVTTEEGGEFLDMDDEDSVNETGANGDASSVQFLPYEGTPRESPEAIAANLRRRRISNRTTLSTSTSPRDRRFLHHGLDCVSLSDLWQCRRRHR